MEIGWWLAPEYWGKVWQLRRLGLSCCMVLNLNLPRIVKGCTASNQRSIRVMEKLGMHFEKMSTDHRIEVVYYAKDKLGIRSTL